MTDNERRAIYMELLRSRLEFKREQERHIRSITRLRRKHVKCLIFKNYEHAEAYEEAIKEKNEQINGLSYSVEAINLMIDEWRKSA